MSDLSRRIANLSPETRALLERCLEGRGRASPPVATIPRHNDSGVRPLSFAQERLWLLHELEDDQATYNSPFGFRLQGPLNEAALRLSLDEIVRRHEVLRASFPTVDGQPVQVIAPPLPLPLRLVDLRDSAEVEREILAMRLCGGEARRSFNLSQGPLIRACLLRLGDLEHLLVVTMHHTVTDGWSLGVFNRELGVLYGAYIQGKQSPLPELAIQYTDFAQWQRQSLRGALLESQLAYWKRQLAGAPALLELPTDRPRPMVRRGRGARRAVHLSASLSEALRSLSQREGATLFMTLLAAFQLLLHRYTGQEDILVGCPIAGRNRTELEDLIGLLVNTLVLRTDLSGNPSFRELLDGIRQVALAAYAHQELPFERLVAELQPQRSLAHTPIVQILFALHNAPAENPCMPGLLVSPVAVETGTAKADLTLALSEGPDGLTGAFEYDTDLFEEGTMARMAAHFAMLLESILADPDQPIRSMPLLADAEKVRAGRPTLLPPAPRRAEPENTFVVPRTPTEEVVAAVWGQALGLDRIGIRDNFFDLGGHSLMAAHIISRIRELFRIDLPLRELFSASDVASLSTRIESARRRRRSPAVPPIQPVSRQGELPLTVFQEQYWTLDQAAPGKSFHTLSFAYRIRGCLNRMALARSLTEIVRRHEVLRSNFVARNGHPVLILAPPTSFRLAETDLRPFSCAEREVKARQLVHNEVQRPFDLVHDPLLRAALFQLDQDEYLLLLTMHHIVSDGWSVSVLKRELEVLYEAYSTDNPSPLPELPIQYADFAYWQRQELRGGVLQAQLSYWKERLAGGGYLLKLPIDRSGATAEDFHTACRSLVLPKTLVKQLNDLGRRESSTFFMTLLAGFTLLLNRYSGQEDIRVATFMANRNRGETEDLIGLFTNGVILCIDLSGDPTFCELLHRARETVLDAQDHQEVPFRTVGGAILGKQNRDVTSLVQVLFASHQTLSLPPVKLSSLTVDPLDLEERDGAMALDLAVSIRQEQLETVLFIRYRTALFSAAAVERLLRSFRDVLDSVVAHPEQRGSALPSY